MLSVMVSVLSNQSGTGEISSRGGFPLNTPCPAIDASSLALPIVFLQLTTQVFIIEILLHSFLLLSGMDYQ